jgi:uncharacterized protein (TIGR02996 family)
VNEEPGLLAAVIENPDDDLPRLVYADWLDDNGQPERARFIRVQCEIARTGGTADLLKEEADLRQRHEAEWIAGLPRLPGLSWSDGEEDEPVVKVERGFVAQLCADNWGKLSRSGVKAFAAAPISCLRVKKLHSVSVESFAKWPLLARVQQLDLSGSGLDDEGLAALAGSARLPRLRELELDCCRITCLGVADLARAEWLGQLRMLGLGSNDIRTSGCLCLAWGGPLPNLEQFRLSCNPLGDDAVVPLVESGFLPPHAFLNFLWLTARTAAALARTAASARLRALILGWDDIDDTGAEALIESPYLANLTELDLRSNPLSRQACEALRRRFGSTPDRPVPLLLDEPEANGG